MMYFSFSSSTISITDPSITTKTVNSKLWGYQTKEADVRKMDLSPKRLFEPLLSRKVERPTNLQFDIIKYEISKPYVPPVQMKTEYKMRYKLRPTAWAMRKWRQSSVLTPTLRALNLPKKLIFEMPKNESSNIERKSLFKV